MPIFIDSNTHVLFHLSTQFLKANEMLKKKVKKNTSRFQLRSTWLCRFTIFRPNHHVPHSAYCSLTSHLVYYCRNILYLLLRIMGFLMLLPIVQCLLFNLCIGRDPRELHIAVVNDEVASLSECYSAPMSGCYIDSHLSCRYLDKLREKTINLVC